MRQMRSLSALGVRGVRRNKGRYALTTIGATLGVAVLFGVLITNGGISEALDAQAGEGVHPAVVLDPAGTYGQPVPASVLETAARLDGVHAAWGNIWFRATGSGPGAEEIFVNGTQRREGPAFDGEADPSSDRRPRRVLGHPPAAGADEVAIGDHWRRVLAVGLGESFTLQTPTGPAQLTVAQVTEGLPGSMETSIETARRLSGTPPGAFSNVVVELEREASSDAWIAAQSRALGPSVRGRPTQDEGLQQTVDVVQGAFFSVGLLAVFVGAFLLYLTMSMSVAERNRTWGVLRAVGASRSAILRVVLAESVVLGAVATVVGLVVGLVLGRGLLQLAAVIYGVSDARVAVSPGRVGVAVLVGVVVPPIAAVIPAWRAASAEPVQAMRDLHVDVSRTGRGWMVGLPLFLVGTWLGLRPGGTSVDGSVVLVLIGSVLLVPLVLGPVAGVIGRVAAKLSPGLGPAAVGHLVKERRRSAYTLALVMIVLAMILAMGSLQTSLLTAMDRAFRVRFGTDVSLYGFNPLPDDLRARLASLPGVDGSTESSFGRAQIVEPAAREGDLLIIDPATFFDLQGLPWVEGDDDEAASALAEGGVAFVPQVVSTTLGVDVGDPLTLSTSEGPIAFRVGGIYATPEPGVQVVVGAADGARYFGATTPTAVALRAADGTSADELRASVEEVLAGRSDIEVVTTPEERARGAERIQQIFRPFLAVVLVAGLVGMLGLANTLLMGMVRRTREVGILRAIGIGRNALTVMVVVESLTMALTAFVLSLGLGWLLSVALVRTSGSALGFVVEFVPPTGMILPVLGASVLIAVLAAAAPARRASRLDPITALRFE